jgi:drug/metabolite transporter (DMT)-like permease
MLGYLELVACTVMYGAGIVAQSAAARRAPGGPGADLGLLARLAVDRLYLLGFLGQVLGFLLAFHARASLPLYVVQAGASAAVGVAVVLGAVLFGWRTRPAEIGVLLVMAVGLVLLVGASTPSVARDLSVELAAVLAGVVVVAALLVPAVARAGKAVPLAVLAGVQFSVVAITARSIADGPLHRLPLEPLAWLLLVAAVAGQASLIFALRRGTPASTVASMDATTAVVAAVAGLTLMGDQIAGGRQWWVAVGLALVVAGILAFGALARKTALNPMSTPAVRSSV